MIYDDLSNLSKYNAIPKKVLKFISSLTAAISVGRYEITDKIYANIEEYNTKDEFEALLESHKKYIDLQFLLSGSERIDFINIAGLQSIEPYAPDRDIIFYKKPPVGVGSLFLNGRNFAVFFPQDAHAPQITTFSVQDKVKKVVIKMAVDYI